MSHSPPHSHPEDQQELLDRARRLAAEGTDGLAHARRLLEAELRRDSTNYPPLDLVVELLTQAREGPLAIRLLEEYIRYFPGQSDATARLAWVHWEENRREEAVAELRATLARDPANYRARLWLVHWALELDRAALAVEAAGEGATRFPEDAAMRVALAKASSKSGDAARAREAFEEALHLDGGETAALAFAEHLIAHNSPEKAVEILEPFVKEDNATPEMLLRSAQAHFRSNRPKPALELIARLCAHTDPPLDKIQREGLEILFRQMGDRPGEEFAIEQIEAGRAGDSFTLELVERLGGMARQERLRQLFRLLGRDPWRYRRSLARFLSTFAAPFLEPATVTAWMNEHANLIERDTLLWAGTGAWMVARAEWQSAVQHLARHHRRPELRPWMLLLLARAFEATGATPDANTVYREALRMEHDHTEATIRSRLAFNLAMDFMPAAGLVVALDCSEQGRRFVTVEDQARLCVVEALSRLSKMDSQEERSELFRETVSNLRVLAQEDPHADITPILQRFRQRYLQIAPLFS